jgi:hypothetical protein
MALKIYNMPIAVTNRHTMGYGIILSATLFNRNMRLTFDYMAEKPYMRVETPKDLYARYTLSKSLKGGMRERLGDIALIRAVKEAFNKGELINSVCVFAQDGLQTNKNNRIPKNKYNCTCIAKLKYKDKYVAYKLQDRNGNKKNLSAKELKLKMISKELRVDNLILTADTKLRGDGIPVIRITNYKG